MLNLLRASGTPSGLRAAGRLAWRTGEGARHTAALAALARAHPMYPPSARLAKRWVACQLYSHAIGDPLVELLAAQPRSPGGGRPRRPSAASRASSASSPPSTSRQSRRSGSAVPTKEQRDAAPPPRAPRRRRLPDAGGETVWWARPTSLQARPRAALAAVVADVQAPQCARRRRADADGSRGARREPCRHRRRRRRRGRPRRRARAHRGAARRWRRRTQGRGARLRERGGPRHLGAVGAAFDVPAADFDALLELRPSALPRRISRGPEAPPARPRAAAAPKAALPT